MKRNYGIDLLRMLLMFMVVILHVLGQGGILDAARPLSSQYNAAWLIETFAYCAVNCYGIITGYVYYNSKYKISSLFQICLQAWLYSVGIAACVWILRPEHFSLSSLLFFGFPVSHRLYWYLSAYVGLFFIIPFLNSGINSLTKHQTKVLLFVSFLLFTVLPTLSEQDPFGTNRGYSTFWLACLYVVGACIQKYGWAETFASSRAMLIYLASVLLSWGWKIGYESIVGWETSPCIDLISYTSPTIVVAAIALFFVFKNMKISSKLSVFISIFSSAAFGVYLIHEHEMIIANIMLDNFAFLTGYPTIIMVFAIMSSALAIFTVCISVDCIRYKVFQWIHIRDHLEKIEQKYIHFNITHE